MKAVDWLVLSRDLTLIVWVQRMSNIYGQMLLEQGNIEEAESNYEQALEFYAQAEAIFVRDADIEECLETKIKMMRIYRQQGEFVKMKSLLEEA